MKKLTTDFLRKNPTGTACGTVGNTSLSNDKVVDFIDKYFGGEIFVNDDWDEVNEPLKKMYGEEDILGICEIHAKIHSPITMDELLVFCEDEDLKYYIKIMFDSKIKKIDLDAPYFDCPTSNGVNIIGTLFGWYVGEAEGSARFEDGYLDDNEMLFYEVE